MTRTQGILGALAVVMGVAGCASSAPAPTPAPKPKVSSVAEDPAITKLRTVVNGYHRAPERKARDVYRHPVETLTFFGIKPNMTVVELWPFGGWYTEILAPYLKDSGRLYLAAMDPQSTRESDKKYNADLKALLDARPDLYSEVRWSVLAKDKYEVAPPGSADLVLTFRNIHNWAWSGMDKEVFLAAHRALKPGAVLGVVEHRHPDPSFQPKDRGAGLGYVGEDFAIAMIESVGFRLVGKSDVNNNPKDTKDYPKGVWTLPPNYAAGDVDREKYAAIGESDRFTLKFVKK